MDGVARSSIYLRMFLLKTDDWRFLLCRFGRLQIGPALDEFAIFDSPDDNARKTNLFAGFTVGAGPGVSHHDAVALGDDVFDRHAHVRHALERATHVLLGTFRARQQAGWNVGTVVNEATCEVYVADGNVLAVHELFEVVADEALHFLRCHAGIGHAFLQYIDKRCRGLFLDSKNRNWGRNSNAWCGSRAKKAPSLHTLDGRYVRC